jgi:hypothetical protein
MSSDSSTGFAAVLSRFGEHAKRKLSNPAATGEPEDQLRSPLERLIKDLAALCRFSPSAVEAVGESSLADLKTRPDYAITVSNALTGFVEVKAPGKGADPRRYRNPHDKEQWSKLQAIPNLLYTDGNEFALWRSGGIVGGVVRLEGDIKTSGAALAAPPALLALFEDFLRWQPLAPRSAKELAVTVAQLCRLMRDEVTEQLALKSPALTGLAEDWRRLLFPEATDKTFADGYAQAVTFGLLMARARGISLAGGLEGVARQLTRTDSLIGTALKLLTDSSENQRTLKTSLGTLVRVLDAVSWAVISRGNPETWLYFYEDFLEVYDNVLRKQTGSYYTPPQVVSAMVRLVDEALRSRFSLIRGLGAQNVTLADPAVGTGTFLLGVLRQIAQTIEIEEGPGAIPAAIRAKLRQLIAFELQLGPFAVAQLRLVAELTDLTGSPPTEPIRMYVTDTLANPYVEKEYIPEILRPIAESRRQANQIKRLRVRSALPLLSATHPTKRRRRGEVAGSSQAPKGLPKRRCLRGCHPGHGE